MKALVMVMMFIGGCFAVAYVLTFLAFLSYLMVAQP